MRWIVGSSLRFARLVLAVVAGLLVLGVAQLRAAPVDVYPEFAPPAVEIQTEALGLSAHEVEQFVTVPLEQDLLNGVPWLDTIHSTSRTGLSDIRLTFQTGTDLYAARQMVQERMTQAHALPNVGSPPIMVQPLSSVSRVAMIGLTSTSLPLIDLSVLARWKLRPRLMGVPGVANVSVYGQRDQQLQVQVDPKRLQDKGVTLTQVIESAGNALWVSPLTFVEASTPGTGGFIEGPNQRLAVQHVSPITTAAQLADVPIETTTQVATKLGDVATVQVDHQPLIGDAVNTAGPTLYLVVEKFPDADTLAVTRGVEEAMSQLSAGLPQVSVDTRVYRPATYLEAALRHLGLAGAAGLALLVALLWLFGSWRAALVGGLVVPASLTAAACVLSLRGSPLTTLTALGLAAAVCLVVDDVVADVGALREFPTDVVGALARSRGPLGYALVAAGLLVLPFLVIAPQVNAFSAPLVLTWALAVLASTVLALTLTPALALLLPGGAGGRSGPGARLLEHLADRLHRPQQGRPQQGRPQRDRLRAARAATAVAGVLALALVAVVPQWGSGSLLPTLQDRNLLLHLATAEGTSLTETTRVTAALVRELRGLPGVADVGAHVGRAVTSDQIVEANSAQIWLTLDPAADYAAARSAIRSVARGYPGVATSLSTYPEQQVAQRVANATNTADAADLVVRVYGADLATLQAKAGEIAAALRAVPGVKDPTPSTVPVQPGVVVQVDLARAARYGLRPGDVRREATTLTSGLVVGNLYEQAKVFDVVVWGVPGVRSDLSGLGEELISTPSGTPVALKDVATVTVEAAPTAIVHDDVLRSAEVRARVSGDPAAVTAAVKQTLGRISLPPEYHTEVLGSAVAARSDVLRASAVTAAVVLALLLLLQAAVGSWRRAGLLLAAVPVSASGAVLAAPLAGGLWDAGAVAGVVAVLVLAVRHGLLLGAGLAGADHEAVPQVLRQRAVSLLRSAVVTAGASLPVLVLGPRAGLEAVHPLATTLLGGLVSLLVVHLGVLPLLLPRSAPRPPLVPRPAGESDPLLSTTA